MRVVEKFREEIAFFIKNIAFLRERIKRSDEQLTQKQKAYEEDDIIYMRSLSAAILERVPFHTKILLFSIVTIILWLIIWASFAQIDEITKGIGKVIPSKQIQVVQNLEGGIVSDILVQEGQMVDIGQVLVKIDDTQFASTYEENKLRYQELQAKAVRLRAEANAQKMRLPKELYASIPKLIDEERSLYSINKNQLRKNIAILKEKVKQREAELAEAKAKASQLAHSYELIKKEVEITKPLVKKGLVSQVEFLQLSRQANGMKGDLDAVRLSIPRIKSTIAEAKNTIEETKLDFRSKAKEELNEVEAEMARIKESGDALEDQVNRTLVRSPVKGVVKQLLINTVGGVVQPGMDIVEIVPLDDKLLVEARIKPSDVAYIYPGLKALVKFTAYDFAIYGGLEGTVTFVSADTIVDDEGNSFYLVRIKTDKSYLEKEGKKYDILVGMVANVDIITGKKTVMDYILKPILKAKQGALRER